MTGGANEKEKKQRGDTLNTKIKAALQCLTRDRDESVRMKDKSYMPEPCEWESYG